MEVVKRNGAVVPFDMGKILKAIQGAFEDVDEAQVDNNVFDMYAWIESTVKDSGERISVEEIQDIVEEALMLSGYTDVARAYIKYRYRHELKRQEKTDNEILSLIKGEDEYWYTENSNKNAIWITTQRDYIAGAISKDIARNFIFPKDVMEAHDAGIIHIHDLDYAAQRTMTNCSLPNLEDMLQNGTVINGVRIDKPHRFITAATLASQIIAAVASSQYGLTK